MGRQHSLDSYYRLMAVDYKGGYFMEVTIMSKPLRCARCGQIVCKNNHHVIITDRDPVPRHVCRDDRKCEKQLVRPDVPTRRVRYAV